MEFCISLLVETFIPTRKFSTKSSVRTAWGDAHQALSEGFYYWTPNLYVFPVPVVQPHLLRYAPDAYYQCKWEQVAIGGEGLALFEEAANQTEDGDLTQQPLVQLFYELLQNQHRWMVFLEKDCDTISNIYYQSLPEVCESLKNSYTYDRISLGFCSIFSNMKI